MVVVVKWKSGVQYGVTYSVINKIRDEKKCCYKTRRKVYSDAQL